MDSEKIGRISTEQREAMLRFMEEHTCLATGRFTAPDGAREKRRLLNELADALNALPNGVTKTPDKWLKSWQDWRSDTKARAALLKREMAKTGGGQISPKARPLTLLEAKLMALLGPTCAFGHEETVDPMNLQMAGSSSRTVMNNVIILPWDAPGPSDAPQPTCLEQAMLSVPSPTPPSPVPSPVTSEVLSGDESSRTSPWPQVTNIRPVSRGTKRPRPAGSPIPDDDTELRLLNMLERQAEMQADTEAKKLILKERKVVAIENASVAICEAMQLAKQHFNRTDSEQF